jgi:hypothetical protein
MMPKVEVSHKTLLGVKKQMPQVFINGLYPGREEAEGRGGMMVSIFPATEYGSANATRLFQAWSNGRRFVTGKIPDKYIGTDVTVVINEPGFKHKLSVLRVKGLGLFHTAPLEKELVYRNGELRQDPLYENFDCDTEYVTAQTEIHEKVRAARFKNYGTLAAMVLLTFVCPISWLGTCWLDRCGCRATYCVGRVVFVSLCRWIANVAQHLTTTRLQRTSRACFLVEVASR